MSEGFITNGDVQIAFRDSGTGGRDIVLSHGVFANLEYFQPLVERLADRYRVVTYDLRGHGQSGAGPCSVRDHGGDLLALIGQLGLHRPFLVGVSYGAFVALDAASGTPSVAGGVVNIDGPLVDRDDAAELSPDHPKGAELRASIRASIALRPDQWSGSADELADRLSEVQEEHRAFEARRYVEDGKGGYVQHPDLDTATDIVMAGYLAAEHYYGLLSVPALVLVAAQSSVIFNDVPQRRAAAKRLAERRPGLDVRVIDGGHDLVSGNLDEVASAVSSWLQAVTSIGSG
ncbi:MAG TPA: alpha/beta hydrolase [Acidimicrobiales bacterium]|nr:alpha/beta hydrolase [Acidimicrobiales bacterium]